MAQLVRLPPAVDQGRDPAGLQHRHVGRRSRPGSCASRSPPGRPWRCPSRRPAPGPAGSHARSARRRSAARRRRPPRRSRRAARRRRRTAPAGSAAGWRRSRGPASSWPIWIRPPGPVTSASTASNLRSSSLGIPLSSPFRFFLPAHYEGAKPEGEALIDALLTALAHDAGDAIRFDGSRARSDRCSISASSSCAGIRSPISPGSSSAGGIC